MQLPSLDFNCVNSIVVGYENVCYIEKMDPIIRYNNSTHFRIFDADDDKKLALLKFNLEKLKGKAIMRAYLRMTNHSGHDKGGTAELYVGRILKACNVDVNWGTSNGTNTWEVKNSEYLGKTLGYQRVFRVPEWQPTWFIDVTPIIKGWVSGEEENFGLYVSGGLEKEPINIKCNSEFIGLNPLLVITYSDTIRENGDLSCDQKIENALAALSTIYIARDISWSGAFVKNAQATAHSLGLGNKYLTCLKSYFDLCIDKDGKFRNVSEEYFYVSTCGQALIYLYKHSEDARYKKALINLKSGLLSLEKSNEGIITAGGRVEVELLFCVCAFLSFYSEEFDDNESLDIAINQSIMIYDLMIKDMYDGIPLQNLDRPNSKGWSRGMGWIIAGMGKILSCKNTKKSNMYDELKKRFVNLCSVLSNYQNSDGLWNSIIQDKVKPREITGSALIALGFEYGTISGILEPYYNKLVDRTLNGILNYTITGIDMSQCFPMNFYERYEVTDFSGNSDQGYGVWMELYTLTLKREK